MKKLLFTLCSIFMVFVLAACNNSTPPSTSQTTPPSDATPGSSSISGQGEEAGSQANVPDGDSSILIAYFSRVGNTDISDDVDAISSASINLHNGEYVGNTELMARWIQAEVGGDLFLIQTEEPYSLDYDETVERGEGENEENIHPLLATKVENFDDYDIIFLGYPAWAYDLPMPVYSFLDNHDLSGKTVVPFSTSGATSVSQTAAAINQIYPDATVMEGITVGHNHILDAQPKVTEWLKNLGYIS